MSRLWQRLIAWINGMTLRERFLLFASVMVVFAALTDSLFISPLNKLQKQRALQIDQNSEASEAQRVRLEFELQQRRRVRAEELVAEAARVQLEINAVERDIAALAAGGGVTARDDDRRRRRAARGRRRAPQRAGHHARRRLS
jgi:DNA-binding transcriptional ArsR family regulator